MWRLEQWCGTCLLIHGLNLWLMVLVLAMAGQSRLPRFRLGIECLAVVIAALSVWGLLHRPDARYIGVAVQLASPTQPAGDLQVSSATPSSGARTYPLVVGRGGDVRIQLFVDPTCRECTRLWQLLEGIRHDYSGRLCTEIYFFPLELECNPYVGQKSLEHEGACQLAQVVHFVAGRSDAEVFADFYTSVGQTPGPDRWPATKAWASRHLGAPLGPDSIDVGEVSQRLRADQNLAIDYGVESLPTMVIGGQRYSGCPRDRAELLSILQPFLDQRPDASHQR
jgi:hypothetical protein